MMHLIRKQENHSSSEPMESEPPTATTLPPWKVLIIDDEADVHQVTRLNLKRMEFDGRHVELLSAMSAAQARQILAQDTEIAVALVDVVMETDSAGLELVDYIRHNLCNKFIRLIIRTGQPGAAPERQVVDRYDIDDYKDKTELTAQKLYTTMRTALKAYRDIKIIDKNRLGLEYILAATPGLYLPQQASLDDFFRGVLTQITALCKLGNNGLISSMNGVGGTLDGQMVHIQVGIGEFAEPRHLSRLQEISLICAKWVKKDDMVGAIAQLPTHALLLPLKVAGEALGFIYLENTAHLSADDRHLIYVLGNQCAAALLNLRLHLELKEANQESLYMLAVAAEFKDETTGAHISRMAATIRSLALEMGVNEEEATQYGQAGMLHDIGKIGVPDNILQKPDKLTPQEFEVIRRHPEIGAQILSRHRWFALAKTVSLGHHEHWDGRGYPYNLSGEAIPLVCRIAAVADVFDALTHARPYKDAWPLTQVTEEIRSKSGLQFDPHVVEALLRLLASGKLPLPEQAEPNLFAALTEEKHHHADTQ